MKAQRDPGLHTFQTSCYLNSSITGAVIHFLSPYACFSSLQNAECDRVSLKALMTQCIDLIYVNTLHTSLSFDSVLKIGYGFQCQNFEL